jgi:5-(carboxyamino)imidazole ribonucleotide mutase
MPRGVPVATVAINGARNAGVLAVRVLALGDPVLAEALVAYRGELADQARSQNAELASEGPSD